MAAKQKKEVERATRASDKDAKKKRLIKKVQITRKKKSWYPILAPQIFGRAKIGESLVDDAGQLVGRTIKLSLMTLTGDMKKQNITVGFRVDSTANNQAQTQLVQYMLVPASVKRMVRRGRTRIDASFVCQTKDGMKLRIKPFALTLNVTNRSIASNVRNHMIAFLASYAAEHDATTIFKDVVSGRLQVGLNFVARKVYPLRQTDIRVMEVVPAEMQTTAQPQKGLDIAKLMSTAESAPRPMFKRQPRRFPQKDEYSGSGNSKSRNSRGRSNRR